MPLWLEDLLDDPGLGLDLVAGRRGLRRRGPIRWVHISEIPDPTPWLEGGEVLLTTGMGVLDSPESQRKLIAGLDAKGCPAVGFGVGICTDEVPPALVEEADARDLPLFTVPYAVPFIAVTKRISRQIFEEHYATMRGAVDLHRQVLASVLAGTGLAGVLGVLSRPMPDVSWLVFDYYGQLLHARGKPALEADAIWEGIRGRLAADERATLEVGGRVVTGSAVRLGEQVEAYLVVVGEHPLLEHEVLLVEQGLAGVSLELARHQSMREAHRARVDELLHEAGAGRLSGELIADRLARLGVEAEAGYAVLCVGVPADKVGRERAVCTVVEDALAPSGAPVLGRRDGLVHAIVPARAADAAERVAAALRARGWTAAVGRSRVKHEAAALAVALREAQVAATSPSSAEAVRDISSLGLAGLLAGIDDAVGAAAFVEQVLGPALAHDRAEGTGLVDTLRAYQRHGCRPGPAADELRIHRHTLAYRLDRIRDLTGLDPRDGQHLLSFGLALELAQRTGDTPSDERLK